MAEGLENLAKMEYPGRFIIIGQNSHKNHEAVVVYGITGRSAQSRARRMVLKKKDELRADHIQVEPTDEELIKTAKNPELLVYNSLYISDKGIAVSNGSQTTNIHHYLDKNPLVALANALAVFDYEPDDPNYTPRISGCVNLYGLAVLSIIKRAENGSSIRQYFEVPLISGKGKLISTYTGINANPLPSFVGEPLDVGFKHDTSKDIAESVWESLNPEHRVSVACVFHNTLYQPGEKAAIINREDRK